MGSETTSRNSSDGAYRCSITGPLGLQACALSAELFDESDWKDTRVDYTENRLKLNKTSLSPFSLKMTLFKIWNGILN